MSEPLFQRVSEIVLALGWRQRVDSMLMSWESAPRGKLGRDAVDRGEDTDAHGREIFASLLAQNTNEDEIAAMPAGAIMSDPRVVNRPPTTRDALRSTLRTYSRGTRTDVELAALTAGAEHVEIVEGCLFADDPPEGTAATGQPRWVVVSILDEGADMDLANRVAADVRDHVAAGVPVRIAIGPVWNEYNAPERPAQLVQEVTTDELADMLAFSERKLIQIEIIGRRNVETRRAKWAEWSRRINAELERRARG